MGINFRKIVGDTAVAFLAQGVSLSVSVVMALLVPKVLGVEEFGYWQLFIFYSGYMGFFHFGLNDGVYLLHGGELRDEVDKTAINSQFWLGATIQLTIAAIMTVSSILLVPDDHRRYVFVATAVFLLLNNFSLFFGYVFQAMNETKKYSASVVIDRIVFIFPVVALVLMRESSFQPYIVAFAFSKTCSLVYCLWNARDFLRSGIFCFRRSFELYRFSVRTGSQLMLANFADMMVLGVARLLIDRSWGVVTFGKVSLAFSLVYFFITFVTQASMVLFPAFRRSGDDELRSVYRRLRDASGVLFPAVYLLYFPIAGALSAWLPDYRSSMTYLALLMPVFLFDSKMSLCMVTYLKVLRKERVLLYINCSVIAAAVTTSVLSIYLLHSVEFVLLGVSLCVAFRSLFAEFFLNDLLGVEKSWLVFGELALSFIFLIFVSCFNTSIAFLSYLAFYVVFAYFGRKLFKLR
ncbi:lipopolysaccharide biosynthesis protein [Changpingibacter yushuensis]|uniref:lipopolysaccharide biosynthesis protein n=1 Tax=Changpingibacter yushuensis TaxID=2758440 RepID=UPI00165D598C|nr:oligosaccharide flippase family protein [Changpingibacter yushuensis]